MKYFTIQFINSYLAQIIDILSKYIAVFIR